MNSAKHKRKGIKAAYISVHKGTSKAKGLFLYYKVINKVMITMRHNKATGRVVRERKRGDLDAILILL